MTGPIAMPIVPEMSNAKAIARVRPQTARLARLGALAVSAGLTAAELRRIAERRRLLALADEMRLESAAMLAWVRAGADPASAPEPSPVLDAWQKELARKDAAKV